MPFKNSNFDILRLALALLVFFAHWNILTSQKLSNPLFHPRIRALYFGLNPTNPIVSFVILFSVILMLSYFSEIYIEKNL